MAPSSDRQDGAEWRFVECPPPDRAPVYSLSKEMGIPSCLRVEVNEGQYRCGQCNRMQRPGAWLVWVPDNVSPWDPVWSVEESARTSAYNGCVTGWCLGCARRLRQVGKVTGFIRRVLRRA